MAKDFSQFDDNPVMKHLKEAEEEKKKVNDANLILKNATPLKNTANSDSSKEDEKKDRNQKEVLQDSGVKNSVNSVNAGDKPVQASESKKILMNISIRESTKKDWKMFFLEHDLSMTQGIETAVEYLKSEVRKGSIKLSKGGITLNV